MTVKYNQHFLNRLEELFAETDYTLRYEKGNFKPGYCIIRESKVAIVNKYYPLEGKINSLIDLIRAIDINSEKLSEKNQKLHFELIQTELKI